MKRFWDKVAIAGPDDCWDWQAFINKFGYGQFRIGKQVIGAHRVSYLLEYGEFDKTLDVCHSCDNPRCVNPKHLWLGTASDNVWDMAKKGRHGMQRKYGKQCKRGHQYTEDNTGLNLNGTKYCKTCKGIRALQYYRSNKSKNIRKRISKYEELV